MEKISFIEKIVAYIKGDDATVKAAKIQTKAKSYIKMEIGNADVALLKAQDEIDSAQERLDNYICNNGSTDFKDDYVDLIVKAQNDLEDKKAEKESIENTKKFLVNLLKDIA